MRAPAGLHASHVLHVIHVHLLVDGVGPMSRNITLALDEETLRKARLLAARRNLSVSALLREEIHRLVARGDAYEAAHEEARRRLERGSRLGGGPLPRREELHDRPGLR